MESNEYISEEENEEISIEENAFEFSSDGDELPIQNNKK